MMVECENIGLRLRPYDSVELTPQEIEAALLEAKKKKWFHLRHADYWENLEPDRGEIEERIIPSQSHTAKKGYTSISI